MREMLVCLLSSPLRFPKYGRWAKTAGTCSLIFSDGEFFLPLTNSEKYVCTPYAIHSGH